MQGTISADTAAAMGLRGGLPHGRPGDPDDDLVGILVSLAEWGDQWTEPDPAGPTPPSAPAWLPAAGAETSGEGNLAAQVEQCYLNLGTALAAAGASFDDVAKLTVYLVDWTPDKMALWVDGVARAAARLGITATPPLTGSGVAALAEPDVLVEVEAVAVID